MDPVSKKFSRLFNLDDAERDVLRHLHDNYEDIEPGVDVISAGDSFTHSYLLQIGWAAVYKLLPDGTQQILNFAIPGDFIGLYSMVLSRAEHSARTITRARLCRIPSRQLIELFQEYPRLALAICWLGARDAIFTRENVVRIGRQTAYDRLAHIILELRNRLDAVGLVHSDSFELPLTQEMLADALGLTPVHVNRTLKKLKKDGQLEITEQHVMITDRETLEKATGFDSGYLDRDSIPDEITDSLA